MPEAFISDGVREARMFVWDVTDALGNFTRCVAQLLLGAAYAYCVWEDDPGEHKWIFHRDGDLVGIRILRFPTSFNGYGYPDERGEVIFETRCSLIKFASKVRNELRRLLAELGGEEYERLARAAFPQETYASLRALLRGRGAGETPAVQ
jgi:hypothetical protein